MLAAPGSHERLARGSAAGGRGGHWQAKSAGDWPRSGCRGGAGVPTSPSGRGARCGRTTAPTATPGGTCPTTTPAPAPTAGTRTASAGLCDDQQRLCFALAFWNGADPILKERIFGLTGPEGNHGEDAKELWWYLDSTPTHSWMRWRYLYPQAAFPYERLVAENRAPRPARPRVRAARHRRLRRRPVLGHHRRLRQGRPRRHLCPGAGPQRRARRGRRCTCCRRCGSATRGRGASTTASRLDRRQGRRPRGRAPRPRPHGAAPATGRRARCSATTRSNAARLWGVDGPPPTRRTASTTTSCTGADGEPRAHAAPRRRSGTTAHGGCRRDRPRSGSGCRRDAPAPCDDDVATRRWPPASGEADEFYADAHAGRHAAPTRRRVLRQALAGMLWTQAVLPLRRRPLAGRRPGPARRHPTSRRYGRNHEWRHLNNADVISMPDTWEYPWYAAWDLAFHCVPLALVDPRFAKDQLLLLCREWYMHPNGQLPAYEWAFGDVNPPVHAWAALRVFEIDGCPRPRLPRADLPQAAPQLHVVGEPQGRRRQQRVRGRLPRARQHRPDRPVGPAARRRAGWSRPTARRGWPCTA